MKCLILLIAVFSFNVGAQKSLGRDTFMVNVRPVLNGILGDFYQMITLFPDFPKPLIPLVQELDGLSTDKESLKESCPKVITRNCKPILDSLKLKLSRLRTLSMKVLNDHMISNSLHLNSLSGQRLVNNFDLKLEDVKGQLDNASFLLVAQIPHKRQTYQIIKELDELSTLLSLAVVEFIPFMYREDFRHFYFNFVHPLQLQISKNKNYEFLNRNIDSLNFALNLLNMNLTKRKKTPEGMAPYLSVIHNRWNSLLRYYF